MFSLPAGMTAAQEDPAPAKGRLHKAGAVQPESHSVRTSLQLIAGIISRADGDRCPMAPTCSAYSVQAIQQHGLLKGWVMTCDRLMRCGRDELRLSDRVLINGRIRCYDPVDQNDFW